MCLLRTVFLQKKIIYNGSTSTYILAFTNNKKYRFDILTIRNALGFRRIVKLHCGKVDSFLILSIIGVYTHVHVVL